MGVVVNLISPSRGHARLGFSRDRPRAVASTAAGISQQPDRGVARWTAARQRRRLRPCSRHDRTRNTVGSRPVRRSAGQRAMNVYDAIVVGSGISGGWAAKELCEKGLRTLVLERGRDVRHIQDYPTMNMARWDFPLRGDSSRSWKEENPLISRAAGCDATTAHFFVTDADHPYIQEKPFNWVRGYQVGGKSLIWGRACARWSPSDFTAPQRYGYGIPWPIGYEDVAPWYSHVEKFIGVCGTREGIETMPDGEYLPAYELNCVEQHLRTVLAQRIGRHYVSGRWAHITEARPIHRQQGRGTCMNRNLCMRGCPFGGYFSANSSTLPRAQRTGNLTVRPHSVVHSIDYDETLG